jgi:hypothetical protein
MDPFSNAHVLAVQFFPAEARDARWNVLGRKYFIFVFWHRLLGYNPRENCYLVQKHAASVML